LAVQSNRWKWSGELQLLVASRAAALAVAVLGFYFFCAVQNIFAAFGAVLIGSCGLIIAFPATARWLSGKRAPSERKKAFRSDVVTAAISIGMCAMFVARAPQSQPHKCGGPIDTLFGYCVTKSE
jgi:hypothetical protein